MHKSVDRMILQPVVSGLVPLTLVADISDPFLNLVCRSLGALRSDVLLCL